MRDDQTLGRRTIDIHTTQGSSAAPAVRRVLLLAAIGLLCFGTWTARDAVGSESGGQPAAPNDFEKMRNRTFSEEQWVIILRQRVHQPIAIWRGIETGSIEATSSGLSFSGLQFEASRSGVLEHHLSRMGLMAKRPLMFALLFDDPDPEIVLTGASAYKIARDQGEFRPEELGRTTTDQIAGAIRTKLLAHRDVRVRWLAVQILGENRWLTPQDIVQGLNDPTDAIRITTAFWVSMVRAAWSWESDPDNKEQPASGTRLTREQFRERDLLLAEALLNHVNDNSFYVRQMAAETLRAIFLQRISDVQAANPNRKPAALPREFDWVRSDWQRRAGTQKIWQRWWTEQTRIAAP